jgi:hypothetical protein
VNGRQAAEQRLGGEIVWWVPCPTGDAADLTVEIRLRETADFPGADARGLGVRLSRMMLFQVGAGSAVTTRPHRTTLRFGWNEQTESLLGKGWGEPEDGFVWALGGRSVLNLPVPVDDAPRTAIFDMRPRTTTERPQLRLLVQEGGQEAAHLTLPDRLAVAIDLRPAPGRSTIEVTFHHLDMQSEQPEWHGEPDPPFAWALASLYIVPALPAYLPGQRPRLNGRLDDGSLQEMAVRLTGLAIAELAALFEGLGSGCELGLLQQRFACHRPGLLHFAGVRQRELVEALFNGFQGVARRESLSWAVRVAEDRTWRLIEGGYGLSIATPYERFVPPPDKALELEARRLPRLAEKLMEDVVHGERIFVVRFSESAGEAAARAVLASLRSWGDADMLWLVMDETREPGSVERLPCGLVRGFVDIPRLGQKHTLDTILSILANAYVLIRQAARLPP